MALLWSERSENPNPWLALVVLGILFGCGLVGLADCVSRETFQGLLNLSGMESYSDSMNGE